MTELDRLAMAAFPGDYGWSPFVARTRTIAVLAAMRDEPSEGAVEATLDAWGKPGEEEAERIVRAYINHILEGGGQ